MTPEERARKILGIIKRPDAYTEIDVGHIAGAIREAEQSAFERAAKVAEEQPIIYARDTEFDDGVNVARKEIAQSIRDLGKQEA